jgi:hypothetical protein
VVAVLNVLCTELALPLETCVYETPIGSFKKKQPEEAAERNKLTLRL